MKFRPCIDIHKGKVKQIVGGSLRDVDGIVNENFVSEKPASYYADLYKSDGASGGHIILLDPKDSSFYEADLREARAALEHFKGGMQIGGGIDADNAKKFIEMGASHVIVTSYVFRDGQILWENIEALNNAVGREHIVLDLSCRCRGSDYYIVTDRWQTDTDIKIGNVLFEQLEIYCDEFLVHAVDVEGLSKGIDEELAVLLGRQNSNVITYAGGIRRMEDIELLKKLGEGKLDFTIGSALDLFGGEIKYKQVLDKGVQFR